MLDVILEVRSKDVSQGQLFVSILIVLDVILEEYIEAVIRENDGGFNPYCVGCNLRSNPTWVTNPLGSSFNPYCVGCNLRRNYSNDPIGIGMLFQSLLCWM